MKKKNKTALKTIGEAAEELELEPHVIRFWEDNFSNLKPTKLNGRRYYDPDNISMLKQIKDLLYSQNYSIKEAISFYNKNKHPLQRIRIKLESARERLLKLFRT